MNLYLRELQSVLSLQKLRKNLSEEEFQKLAYQYQAKDKPAFESTLSNRNYINPSDLYQLSWEKRSKPNSP